MTGTVYAPVEKHLVKWLPSVRPGVRVVTDTPASLTPPLVQVQHTSGPSYLGTSRPTVNWTCFHSDRSKALDLGAGVLAAIENGLRGVTLPIATIDGTVDLTVSWMRTITAPVWVPYGNTDVRAVLIVTELFAHARSRT